MKRDWWGQVRQRVGRVKESRKGKGELSVSGWRSAEESKHVLRGQVVFRCSKKNRWGIQSTADKGVWSRG